MGKPESPEEYEHFKTQGDDFDVYIHKDIMEKLGDKKEFQFFIEGYGRYVIQFID